MNLPWVKNVKIVNPSHSQKAVMDSKYLFSNLVGSFLVLVLSVMAVGLLLLPQFLNLFRQFSPYIAPLAALLPGLFLAVFLISLPFSWFLWSLTERRMAKALNRRGIVTKGVLMVKWIDEENGQPAYYIHYKYDIQLNATQKVDRETFEQTGREETLYILYLEDQPMISRLDMD